MRGKGEVVWADSLATLPVPVPEPSTLALRYYHSGNVLWVVDTLVGFLVPGLVLFTGWSAGLRTWAAQVAGGRRGWTLLLYVVAFVLLTTLATLPLDFYEGFVRQHAYGLSNQTPGKWFGDGAKALFISCVIAPLLALGLYAVLRRSPSRWWLWATGAALPLLAFAFLIAPVWIDPLFNHYGPVQDKALEARILQEAHRAGIEGSRVFEVNKSVDTKTISAYVTGFGRTKRIVLFDTILRKLTPEEILFVVGHEMGHFVLRHVLLGLAGTWLLVGVSLYTMHRLAGGFLGGYGSRFGFDRLDDPASVPLLLLLVNAVSLVASPLVLAGSRHLEHEADRFGLELTHDNHAAAMAFVKLQEENLDVPRPGLPYTIWRASHPSLGERIEFANGYHPWTTGAPLVYGDRFTHD
jgi:Zn-dependent protease with chaperone function